MMACTREYHRDVNPRLPASIKVLGLLLSCAVGSISSQAQVNGPPTSVTSQGFGGRAVNGPPSSVTSLGPRGYSPAPRFSTAPVPSNRDHHNGTHRRANNYGYPLLYAVPVPYGSEPLPEDENAANVDPNDQGGPTVFDRRGSGEKSYIPPVRETASSYAPERRDDAVVPETQPDPTLLVFKDGRKLEVGNYAIVGVTLFDLTPGHSRRIALAELDLEATRNQNEDRGVVFQLPALRAN